MCKSADSAEIPLGKGTHAFVGRQQRLMDALPGCSDQALQIRSSKLPGRCLFVSGQRDRGRI